MNKFECLRRLVTNFRSGACRAGPITTDTFDQFDLVKATLGSGGRMIGVNRAGLEALLHLSEHFHHEPAYERGCTFEELTEAVFRAALQRFFERASEPITNADLTAFEADILQWLVEGAVEQRLYIPCAISNAAGPAFSIGPVKFQYINEFVAEHDYSDLEWYDRLIESMGQAQTSWMASVDVAGCRGSRVWDVGSMAVDLALVGLQLVVPHKNSQRMARQHARRVPAQVIRLSVTGDDRDIQFINQSAGLTLSEGELERRIVNNAAILVPVGNRVTAFLTGDSSTRALERAWSDAAYWYHEGLAETLDSAAIPKLETAIEVLLRAESASGSERRVLTALEVFYGRKSGELINRDSIVTVGQFAKRIVKIRSNILHGTRSTLHHSVGASRDSLAQIVAGLLRSYAVKLDQYRSTGSPCDKLQDFLAWVEGQRPYGHVQ